MMFLLVRRMAILPLDLLEIKRGKNPTKKHGNTPL